MTKLHDDSLKYLQEHNVTSLMEHILRNLVIQMPEKPAEFIHKLLEKPIPPQLIISGPPASGKGTQCKAVVEHLNVVHISSGDLLRAEVTNGTEVGKMADSYIKKGALVPDKLIIGIIRHRLEQDDVKERGWLLDGFPRTKAQAEALEKDGIVPHAVIILDVPDEVVVERIALRRTDPATGVVYHLKYNPPPANDVVLCERLVQRADDNKETVEARLKIYRTNLTGLEEHYSTLVEKVNGDQTLKDVENGVLAATHSRQLI